tara:strand:- start:24933 stop:25241 length:309 start_codon:yes stop_codon:yes gene_type:complete
MKYLLIALMSFSALATTVETTVIGHHAYEEGKPILLKESAVDCYFMTVMTEHALQVVGKSCPTNAGMDTFKVVVDEYVKVMFPTDGGEKVTFNVKSMERLTK